MAIFGLVCIIYFSIAFIVFLHFVLTETSGNIFDGIVLIIAVGIACLWPVFSVYYILEWYNNKKRKK
ncbi:hypothetical protein [Yersinia phage fHe-Yen9-04]|uniref:Uncharacterized protein n=1 Tax=Yersinia phage fHe-Yen9-04 TaxID=2052742 RepID=A0A2C9CYE0_9CAUD|nr:hypothetical protein FDJ41_gp071 [Yersinia phage fHe-Yen9-04]SOK58348.1 hypothetical protein [Yersinia phage fHe-Yen9-04]VUE36117.1 hypothetical protein [Yersinia phage fHe-Yen9-04]